MTTRQRIDLLARAYPQLFPRTELLRLVREQLGDIDALDKWIACNGVRVRARAPKIIYHICAGNLAVSAWTSLAHGLLLGARNVMKLPGDREDSSARREILNFIRGLPAPLRKLVETHRTLDVDLLHQADAVVAFGSDTTMKGLRALIRWDQKFIAHGHAVSLLWLADPNRLTPSQARACAVDVLTYDQLGCLSPQAIYVPPGTDFDSLGRKLARALETHWRGKVAGAGPCTGAAHGSKKPSRGARRLPRPLSVTARITEARDMAHALGHRVWLPPKNHLGWTLIHDPNPAFQPSPLHGVIYLRQATEAHLPTALASVAGRISTVGVAGQLSAGRLSARLENVFLNLGVSRFCAAGHMQFPPLTWHHDGRSSLADLVTWIDAENLT
jgi:acyl-CoA reductase LuxC